MQDPVIDSREFRNTMGRFATGVTVVTVKVGDQRRGMTANAVTSLSLHPPMLLVCVDKSASMHPLFQVADSFAVNILAADQKALSDFFARHSDAPEVLGGFPYREGVTGSPLVEGALASVECHVSERIEGGDHIIVIGSVQAIHNARPEDDPLLFFSGKYRAIAEAL